MFHPNTASSTILTFKMFQKWRRTNFQTKNNLDIYDIYQEELSRFKLKQTFLNAQKKSDRMFISVVMFSLINQNNILLLRHLLFECIQSNHAINHHVMS